MTTTTRLKALGTRFAGTTLLFCGVVSIGTNLCLLVASCLGYLPYSDRPGPGWWGRVHHPSWGEIGFYTGLIPWFAYFALFFGVGLFVLSLILGFVSTPRWLNRIIGGIISALAAGISIAAGGWYIALAPVGPDIAIGIGLIYGIFLFPRFVITQENPRPLWLRIISVSLATALFLYWIVSPFLPHTIQPGISYSAIRVTPSGSLVQPDRSEPPEVAKTVAELGLHGDVHGGIGGSASGDPNSPDIYVEVIAMEPITKKAKLRLPKTGYVVYVLKGGNWTAYPEPVKFDKRKLVIEPGTDLINDGGKMVFDDIPGSDAFTWYPVIPKSQ